MNKASYSMKYFLNLHFSARRRVLQHNQPCGLYGL